MAEPWDSLRLPSTPIPPDPAFSAALRARLVDAVLTRGGTRMQASARILDPAGLGWPTAVTPYIGVPDGRAAIDWYLDVFDAQLRGTPYVMDDDSIGHAELQIGDGVLMLAGGPPGAAAPIAAATVAGVPAYSLHLQVPDVDATVDRAVAAGATLERAIADEDYGRNGVIRDPFGHRWLVMTEPGSATRARHGDLGYLTIGVPDEQRAQRFWSAVLGWEFDPGSMPRGFEVRGTQPPTGMFGGADGIEVQLCFRVADVDAAVRAIRGAGGQADEPMAMPYGRIAECHDDQGLHFQVWQPA